MRDISGVLVAERDAEVQGFAVGWRVADELQARAAAGSRLRFREVYITLAWTFTKACWVARLECLHFLHRALVVSSAPHRYLARQRSAGNA